MTTSPNLNPVSGGHTPIGVERCSCGHPSCRDYWLVGMGKFVQGSGFTKDEARLIAAAPEMAEALRELLGTISAQRRAGIRWDPETVERAEAIYWKATSHG